MYCYYYRTFNNPHWYNWDQRPHAQWDYVIIQDGLGCSLFSDFNGDNQSFVKSFTTLQETKDYVDMFDKKSSKAPSYPVPSLNTLACNVPAPAKEHIVYNVSPEEKTKGNKPMCYECECDYDDDCCSTDTVTEKKTQYLKGRAYRIRDDKQTELRKKFSMDAELAPKTPEEFIERIVEGRYTLMEKDKRPYWANAVSCIEWRDPKNPADPVGYEAANKNLDKEYQKILDTIMIAEPAEALKAIQEFEEA